MKRIIFTIILVLLMTSACYGTRISIVTDKLGGFSADGGNAQDDSVKSSLDLLHSKIGGMGIGTGSEFYVDSAATGLANGTSWTDAVVTLDAGVNLCTDSRGDIIHVAQGHNENWTGTDSADVDVIGVIIKGHGSGTLRPRFDYDDADAELVIAAANVSIYNLTFQPGYNQVVHAIEIEADADGSIIDNCEFFDGEAESTDEFLDAIQPATAADDLIISNCIAKETSAGANTWLDMSTGIIDNVAVVNNRAYGSYAEGCIYSNKAITIAYVSGNTAINTATGIAAITFSGAATGTLANNYAASDTPGTIIDPGSMEQYGNVEADYGAAEDADAGPAWAVSTAAGTGAYPINVENDSLFAKLMAMDNGGVATVSDYSNATMSMEALNVDLDAIIVDTTALLVDTGEIEVDVNTAIADTALLKTDVDEIEGDCNDIYSDTSDIDANTILILEDTATTIPATITVLQTDMDEVEGDCNDIYSDTSDIDANTILILEDTATTIPATITVLQTDMDEVEGDCNDIYSDTSDIDANTILILEDTATTIPATITVLQTDMDEVEADANAINIDLDEIEVECNDIDANTILILADTDEIEVDVNTLLLVVERCLEKDDGSVPNGDDALFNITGGPIIVSDFVGIVTDTIGANACNCTIELDVTAPSNTIALSTTVAITDDAIGTSYTFTAASPSVLTPTTNGGLDQLPENRWFCPVGGIVGKFSASNTGTISWYIFYKPLSPSSVVVAAP